MSEANDAFPSEESSGRLVFSRIAIPGRCSLTPQSTSVVSSLAISTAPARQLPRCRPVHPILSMNCVLFEPGEQAQIEPDVQLAVELSLDSVCIFCARFFWGGRIATFKPAVAPDRASCKLTAGRTVYIGRLSWGRISRPSSIVKPPDKHSDFSEPWALGRARGDRSYTNEVCGDFWYRCCTKTHQSVHLKARMQV